MIKISKQKLLLYTALLTLLLIFSTYASNVPMARAAEPSAQDKTMSILSNVLGINTQSYTTILNSQSNNQYMGQPQNKADFNLVSNQGSVRVSSSFVNNTLQVLFLSNYTGTLAAKQPATNTVNMAKNFLARYQSYAGDSFYGTLASTLDNVSGDTNATNSAGNITLKVVNYAQTIVDYIWTYTDANGISAHSKNIELSYDQGQLEVFLNNWPLYKVVGTPKISRDQAISIALEASKNFTYPISAGNNTSTVSVSGFNVVPKSLSRTMLSYVNCPNQSLARGGDPFTLYPSWYVPLGFDKFYPGDVTGITVSVWADTGEVSSMSPMVADSAFGNSTAEATATQGLSQSSTMLSAPVAIAALLSIGITFAYRKRIPKLAGVGKKLFYSRLLGILLCATIAVSALVPTVAATRQARIYGALDGGNGSPAQLQYEKDAAWEISWQIASDFNAISWSWSNDVEYGTYAQYIVSQAQSDEANYDRVSVFHFGHLYDFSGHAYVDNGGYPVWARNGTNSIYPQTAARKHTLVFIWVCNQAMSATDLYGMPVAWTHNPYMSSYGYLAPDTSGQCYIGFNGFSPLIGYSGQTFEEQWTLPAKIFIEWFYGNATLNNYCVNDALNLASIGFFQTTYDLSILNTGYNAWWPGDRSFPYPLNQSGYYPSDFPGHENDPLNSMKVFGDGEIWLNPTIYTLTVSHTSGGTMNYDPGVYPYTAGTIVSAWAYPDNGYLFDHWIYDGQYGGNQNPTAIDMDSDHTLQAVFTPAQPVYHSLTVYAYDLFDGSPVSTPVYLNGAFAGYSFEPISVLEGWYWVGVDSPVWNYEQNRYEYFYFFSEGIGSNPTFIPVTSDKTVTAAYINYGKK